MPLNIPNSKDLLSFYNLTYKQKKVYVHNFFKLESISDVSGLEDWKCDFITKGKITYRQAKDLLGEQKTPLTAKQLKLVTNYIASAKEAADLSNWKCNLIINKAITLQQAKDLLNGQETPLTDKQLDLVINHSIPASDASNISHEEINYASSMGIPLQSITSLTNSRKNFYNKLENYGLHKDRAEVWAKLLSFNDDQIQTLNKITSGMYSTYILKIKDEHIEFIKAFSLTNPREINIASIVEYLNGEKAKFATEKPEHCHTISAMNDKQFSLYKKLIKEESYRENLNIQHFEDWKCDLVLNDQLTIYTAKKLTNYHHEIYLESKSSLNLLDEISDVEFSYKNGFHLKEIVKSFYKSTQRSEKEIIDLLHKLEKIDFSKFADSLSSHGAWQNNLILDNELALNEITSLTYYHHKLYNKLHSSSEVKSDLLHKILLFNEQELRDVILPLLEHIDIASEARIKKWVVPYLGKHTLLSAKVQDLLLVYKPQVQSGQISTEDYKEADSYRLELLNAKSSLTYKDIKSLDDNQLKLVEHCDLNKDTVSEFGRYNIRTSAILKFVEQGGNCSKEFIQKAKGLSYYQANAFIDGQVNSFDAALSYSKLQEIKSLNANAAEKIELLKSDWQEYHLVDPVELAASEGCADLGLKQELCPTSKTLFSFGNDQYICCENDFLGDSSSL